MSLDITEVPEANKFTLYEVTTHQLSLAMKLSSFF